MSYNLSDNAKNLVDGVIGNPCHPELEPFPLVMAYFQNVRDWDEETKRIAGRRLIENRIKTAMDWIKVFRSDIDSLEIELNHIKSEYGHNFKKLYPGGSDYRSRCHRWVGDKRTGQTCIKCGVSWRYVMGDQTFTDKDGKRLPKRPTCRLMDSQ